MQRSPAKLQRRRLLPKQRVYLVCVGEVDADRFSAHFRHAWKRLGLSVRRSILGYWRRHPMCALNGTNVGLTNSWRGRRYFALGCSTLLGSQVLFWAPAVNLLPDELLQTLIVHELAHVWMWSHGNHANDVLLLPGGEDYDEDADEARVSELLDIWGFDDHALECWQIENIERVALHEGMVGGPDVAAEVARQVAGVAEFTRLLRKGDLTEDEKKTLAQAAEDAGLW